MSPCSQASSMSPSSVSYTHLAQGWPLAGVVLVGQQLYQGFQILRCNPLRRPAQPVEMCIRDSWKMEDFFAAKLSASMVLSKHSTCSSSESRKVFSRERTVDMTCLLYTSRCV